MRIALGGIAIENSNFSSVPTTMSDLDIMRGEQMFASARYPFLSEFPAEFLPTLFAGALPGGPLDAKDYQTLKQELLQRLQAFGPVDGFYLDLHGALFVDGLEDAEADLAAAVRAVVGPQALIGASMDLHGNVSHAYVRQIDLLTAYRTAPHRDTLETRRRAVKLLVETHGAGVRPQIALAPIPVLLSGEATRTDVEPGHSLWASLSEIDSLAGVLDASLFVGFAWVDEPRAHAAAVVTGTDSTVIQQEASRLAQTYWDVRHQFQFGTPTGTIDECIVWALAAPEPCVFLSDSGDNTTAGAVGDTPFVLERLLAHKTPGAIVAGLVDPEAVATCWHAGIGQTVRITVGGKLDPAMSAPLPVQGEILNLFDGDLAKGRQAVVQVDTVKIVLTERRSAFTQERDFTQVGINPLAHKIVVVKLGYLFPDLLRIAPRAYMALSPGAADQHLARLPYRRITRPMFPLDQDFAWKPG
jgi:microcystin degradation protein MlrC